MPQRIYLDNNSSTPLDPRVCEHLKTLLPALGGNPSSTHSYGRAIKGLIAKSRDTIAAFLGVKPSELIFTSSGTESANLAIRGLAANRPKGHIITSGAEHSCVIAACKLLEVRGHAVTFLSPGEYGAVTPEAVKSALRPDTCLVALMAVNNETGVKTDISAIAKIAQQHNVPFFVDGVAQLGKEPVHIVPGITAMSFSGHKIHALQGIGLLYLRSGAKLQPLIVGGEQEHGRRAGTENVLGIISFGKAVELMEDSAYEHIRQLRDHFEKGLGKLDNVRINGEGSRVSNVSNLAFEGIDGETLLMQLDKAGIAASHGSACSSGALEPSRVLLSMGLPTERVTSSIRFSFSRLNTLQEVEAACQVITKILNPQTK